MRLRFVYLTPLTPPARGRDALVDSTLNPDDILQTSPDTFRCELKRMSRDDEPARWAAEHLKLGAVLRTQARKQVGAKRVRTLRQAISAFEEALRYYCKLGHPHGALRYAPSSDDPPRNPRWRDPNEAGIELVLNAVRQPILRDIKPIEDALALFTDNVTDQTRHTAFRGWLIRRLNQGCALTLLGKIQGAQGDLSGLERAVLACQELLAEPILRDLTAECALVYINLAEALRSLGNVSASDERARYFESAVDSLAMALRQVAPPLFAPLVVPKPISFN